MARTVNFAGGALATGNPWGAAGAVCLTRLVHGLRRLAYRVGMAVQSARAWPWS